MQRESKNAIASVRAPSQTPLCANDRVMDLRYQFRNPIPTRIEIPHTLYRHRLWRAVLPFEGKPCDENPPFLVTMAVTFSHTITRANLMPAIPFALPSVPIY